VCLLYIQVLVAGTSAQVLQGLEAAQGQALGSALKRLLSAVESARELLQRWMGPKQVSWVTRFVRNKLDLDDIKDVSAK
jgi:hypothetical protein